MWLLINIMYYTIQFLLKMNQQNPFKKAVKLSKQYNYKQAISIFSQILQKQSTNYSAYLNRGSLKLCLNQFSSAIDDFSKCIQLQPLEMTAYYNRFISFYKLGNKIQAQKDIYLTLSLSCIIRGKQLKIVKLFNRAINLVENNVLAYLERGNLFREHANSLLAENDYTGALQHDPNYISALSARASLYKQQKKQQQAQEDVQRLSTLLKNRERNIFKLIPNIQNNSQDQIQSDIQSKLKQFKQLRTAIFKMNQQNKRQDKASEGVVQVKSKQQDLRIFNSFNDQSNSQSTNQNISNKAITNKNILDPDNSSKNLMQQQLDDLATQNNAQNPKTLEISQQSQNQTTTLPSNMKKIKNPVSLVFQSQENPKNQNQSSQSSSLVVVPYSKLEIVIISADLSRDTQLFGSMSPYVQCQYNGWVQRTVVAEKAGKHPVWNNSLQFNYIEGVKNIQFRIFDKQTFKKDDLVCFTSVSIKSLVNCSKIKLYYNKIQAGALLVQTTFKQAKSS